MWDDLQERAQAAKTRQITKLFEKGNREASFTVRFEDFLLDYSKTQITQDDLNALLTLAEHSQLTARRDAMFSGEKINETEDRAVLHTALRNPGDRAILVDGQDVMPGV